MNKTHTPKPADVTRTWHLLDAKGQVLGRLATQVAVFIMGKNKPDFARHIDMGDHVVVINASEIVVTGRKAEQKNYHRHSGYPGGMKVTTYRVMHETKPEEIILHAVDGMIPRNKLHDKMLKHLHIYPGAEHPYTKQFKQ
jgi:large subunit ribosomal protein L13